MPRNETALLDILRAARLAVQFKGDLDKEGFLDDLKTQSAILHQLLLLGEAVKRLSEEFRARHPDVPLRAIAGMRDKLIHEYNEVDVDEVWRTVTSDLPRLIGALEPLAPRQAE